MSCLGKHSQDPVSAMTTDVAARAGTLNATASFEIIDKNTDGLLTKSEIKKYLSPHSTLKEFILHTGGWQRMFISLDSGEDGVITKEEWVMFFTDCVFGRMGANLQASATSFSSLTQWT